MANDQWKEYRDLIDALVDQTNKGQGAIGARRVREGLWNPNATPDFVPEDHRVNLMLKRLSNEDRELIARMLQEEFTSGVHTVLVELHEREFPPFEHGYEGTPFHDYMGRLVLGDWEWPTRPRD